MGRVAELALPASILHSFTLSPLAITAPTAPLPVCSPASGAYSRRQVGRWAEAATSSN